MHLNANKAQRLTAVEFASQLLQSGDLDPIYLALDDADVAPVMKARVCVGYWMFYHLGVACVLAESGDFWAKAQEADIDKWPRGTERRHFRGANSAASIDYLRRRFPYPQDAVSYLATGNPDLPPRTWAQVKYDVVMRRAQEWRGFGPWIAFKIADMLDAVMKVDVDFTGAEGALFDDPKVGALLVEAEGDGLDLDVAKAKEMARTYSPAQMEMHIQRALGYIAGQPGIYKAKAPHAPHRTLRLQEFETIFCKYKSHLNGHYPVGKDTAEVLHGLWLWKDRSELAETFHRNLERRTQR